MKLGKQTRTGWNQLSDTFGTNDNHLPISSNFRGPVSHSCSGILPTWEEVHRPPPHAEVPPDLSRNPGLRRWTAVWPGLGAAFGFKRVRNQLSTRSAQKTRSWRGEDNENHLGSDGKRDAIETRFLKVTSTSNVIWCELYSLRVLVILGRTPTAIAVSFCFVSGFGASFRVHDSWRQTVHDDLDSRFGKLFRTKALANVHVIFFKGHLSHLKLFKQKGTHH